MVVPPNRQNRRAEPEDLDSDSESSSDDDTLLPIEPSASDVPSNTAREENPNPLTRRPQGFENFRNEVLTLDNVVEPLSDSDNEPLSDSDNSSWGRWSD